MWLNTAGWEHLTLDLVSCIADLMKLRQLSCTQDMFWLHYRKYNTLYIGRSDLCLPRYLIHASPQLTMLELLLSALGFMFFLQETALISEQAMLLLRL